MNNTTTTPTPQPDYPAAHSMDTLWFAVDANGELACLNSDSNGPVPALEGMRAPTDSDGLRNHYTPAYDYHDQYEAIGKFVLREVNEKFTDLIDRGDDEYFSTESTYDVLPSVMHHLDPRDEFSYYRWVSSPRQKIWRLEDLPEDLRSPRYLLYLNDYSFRSREPLSPYDYAPHCYDWLGNSAIFPLPYSSTPFPLPGRQGQKLLAAYYELAEDRQEVSDIFFAIDDEGLVALFHTPAYGAVPRERQGGAWHNSMRRSEPTARPLTVDFTALLDPVDLSQYGPGKADISTLGPPLCCLFSQDAHVLEFEEERNRLPRQNVIRVPEGILYIYLDRGWAPSRFTSYFEKGQLLKAWRWGWARHYIEYPFGIESPRLWGFYHYDCSWYFPLPYQRIGVPNKPVHVDSLPAALREQLNPFHFVGAHFAEQRLIQPFEFTDCHHATSEYARRFDVPDLWIDSTLTRVNPCHPFAVKFDDDERLLRHARRHVERIDCLWLPDPRQLS